MLPPSTHTKWDQLSTVLLHKRFSRKFFLFLLYDKTLVTGQKQLRDAHLIFLTSCVTMVTSVPLHLNADRAEVVVLFGLLR